MRQQIEIPVLSKRRGLHLADRRLVVPGGNAVSPLRNSFVRPASAIRVHPQLRVLHRPSDVTRVAHESIFP